MTWLQAGLLGIVQGLTEFLPVSSTAHLRIVPSLLGWPDPGAAFSAVIQLGTLAAVLVYFASDIRHLTTAALLSLWRPQARRSADARLAWAIAAGNVPIFACGLAFRRLIETEATRTPHQCLFDLPAAPCGSSLSRSPIFHLPPHRLDLL